MILKSRLTIQAIFFTLYFTDLIEQCFFMGLDFSEGCVNFRDVGECVNLLAGRTLLPVCRIFRGGKLDFVATAEAIGTPGTIINLRRGEDDPQQHFNADHWHFPISNDHEKYDTTDPVVRRWLNQVIRCVSNDVEKFPILFHCTSGKDRTGVVVGVLLAIIGIDRALIVDEYLWSQGDVDAKWITQSLDGVSDVNTYFKGIKLAELRKKLIGNGASTVPSRKLTT